mgnify:CR=1 FL=1
MKMNKKGFTLVELLVVVSIIGILAGIVLVSLNSGRERTRRASLQSTLASIITVANMCVNDSGTIVAPDSATDGGGNICSLATEITEVWPGLTHITGVTYEYITTNDTTISAGTGTTPIVTCTVATSSCVMN